MKKMHATQTGNIMFYILAGIFMIGLVTVALRGTSPGSGTIDNEEAIIKLSQVARFGQQIEEGVNRLLTNGISEGNLRFAHPLAHADYGTLSTTPAQQVFHTLGGNVTYQEPPKGITTASGTDYEIYATTDIPLVGSNKADFTLVLPGVTKAFCDAVNRQVGLDIISTYPGDPVAGTPNYIDGGTSWRYNSASRINATPNTFTSATFSRKPVTQGCVACTGVGCGVFYYFYVILAR